MRNSPNKCFHLIIGLFLLALLYLSKASAEDPAALAARLHATAAGSSIDTPGLSPWHLKMDIQLFDAKGQPSEKGTIEEWWASPELNRVTFTLPAYTVTRLHNANGLFITKSKEYEPSTLDYLLDQVVHPMPHEDEIDKSSPTLRKQKFGKAELDCIILDPRLKNLSNPPLGLFPSFCLDPGENNLRISTDLGSLTFVRNSMGLFQGRSVALDLKEELVDMATVTGHVTKLSTFSVTDADFVPGPDMEPVAANATPIGASVMAAQAVSRQDPIYPASAKQGHITGTVVLHAIIGRDGRIESLRIVSTPDVDLAISALAAVRRWTYRPYLLNGVPTEVDTTITVHYAMN